jgi:hypothetical protein
MLVILLLAGTSIAHASNRIMHLIPKKFGNVKYSSTLVQLHVLNRYSSGELNQNTADIYLEINDLIGELLHRTIPFSTYGKIKRQSIADINGAAINTIGARLK